MGLFSWLFQWFGGSRQTVHRSPLNDTLESATLSETDLTPTSAPETGQSPATRRRRQKHIKLRSFNRSGPGSGSRAKSEIVEVAGASPYRFARFGSQTGRYLDLSQDGNDLRLIKQGLPVFHTPEELADWLGLPLNKLAWLVHRFSSGKPASIQQSHYHYTWRKKHAGGMRLIESPKQTLKQAQIKILHEILNKVQPHPSAHGFVIGRSILTNATPHVGQAIILKFDLQNFYPTVGFARVVAIFRSLGYSRESAIWLGLLTTSAVPANIPLDRDKLYLLAPYLRRHLPQGAPTSPALANLSAYRLDARLTGMARAFGARFTRYADDLTFSGPQDLSFGLRAFVPLVEQIIRRERFRSNRDKRQVLRSHQRQSVAGVVVNARTNVARSDYDRLKAILTNSVRLGPSSQNREQVDDFAAHLRGRIAHVLQLNSSRGNRLLALYQQIDWRR